MIVRIKKLHPDVLLPQYSHPGDAGMDLYNMGEEVILKPLARGLIPTGLKVAVPAGYELQVRPRSGMALKKGLTVLNTPGTIDAGYRGEVGIIVFNASGDEAVTIKKGDRIAQIVLKKVEEIEWNVVDELDETSRNEGGFGSTGHK
ncbi:MAG: dUTP diphosphatase [bacterium]|nr:dUTP diphosphatase [bacterium]MDD5756780.1 dUTP diphosphatase [bacterium]